MSRLSFNARIALRSLWAHRLRSTLTMLGIVIGIGAVITTVAVGRGARQEVIDELRSLGSNLILVLPGAERKPAIRLDTRKGRSLTRRDAEAIAQNIPLIGAIGASITENGRVIAGNRNWATRISGITPGYLAARDWDLDRGQDFAPSHFDAGSKVVLVGGTVARELFGGRAAVGRRIRIGTTPFTVIGVLEPKGQSPSGGDQDDIVFLPMRTARVRVFGRDSVRPDAVGALLAQARSEGSIGRAAEEIRALLRQRHGLLPGQPDDFRVLEISRVGESRDVATRQFTWLLAVIASVSLLVGGIGIMNTMLVSVSERLREIGVHIALGAEPADLLNQFLTESLLIAILGGALGVAFGIGVAHFVSEVLGWRTVVEFDTVLIAVGVAMTIGIAFGLYPALKTARLDPIASLRAE